eukprot:CAMPEP_0183365910 /NCGR_PEP_ID=MMETSP0164_2-20130417/86592_1 /TAXON_ID=221442 /ORGANISM="Coccolithus pelagicus ssp braarudi, Strain PLY182g" /LENGTH=38 /DNA_ID= /DNA_START= /DNA_END= /DNA_ORIENTATION=
MAGPPKGATPVIDEERRSRGDTSYSSGCSRELANSRCS